MHFPIAHNGQIYDVVYNTSSYNEMTVAFSTEVMGDPQVEEIDERGFPEDVDLLIGRLWLEEGEDNTWVRAQNTYSWITNTFRDITEAIAFLVDNYGPCSHGDATCLGGTKWQCDICGADFEREDEDEEQYIPDYEIPWGTPDSWIPDNPNEDGFTQRDFI